MTTKRQSWHSLAMLPSTHNLIRNHRKIVYDQLGDNKVQHNLILLHGLASNATRWHEFMQHSNLYEEFELIAMDLRGHGRSLVYERFTRLDWIEDIQQLLDQHRKPSILVGHSMGAQIALDYASQSTNRNDPPLTGLVLIDPIFPQALDGILKKIARFRMLLKIGCWVLRAGYAIGLHKRHYPYRDLQALDQNTRAFLAANPDKRIADLYMNPLADLPYMPLANYLQDLYEVTRPLLPMDQIHVPVLVLLSENGSTSHVDLNKQILGSIPDLEIKTIEADHWLLTEKPVEAREVIEQWCRQQLTR